MRIALHLPDPGWLDPSRTDGDATLVRDLVVELGQQGHAVQMVTLMDVLAMAESRASIAALILESYRVWRRMRRFDPDAWVVYMSSPRRPDLFCWWQRPSPYIHMYPGPRRARKPVPRGWKRFFAWAHRQAVSRSHVLVTYRPEAVKRPPFGVDPERVVLLPFGSRPPTNLPEKVEARRALNIPETARVVLCVTRLLSQSEGRPGRTEAVLDLVGMADGLPEDTQIVVVGDGSGREAVENARMALSRPERVRMEGKVLPDRVSTYYAAADVFAFPCRDDRPWVVLVEAQMHGLAVITMRTPSSEMLVVQEVGGILAEDLADFRDRLHELVKDEDRRDALGVSARTYAEGHLTTEHWVRNLISAIGSARDREEGGRTGKPSSSGSFSHPGEAGSSSKG